MDGTVSEAIVTDRESGFGSLTIDHYSDLLFWLQWPEFNPYRPRIMSSDPDGQKIRLLIELYQWPEQLRVDRQRICWIQDISNSSWKKKVAFCCDKVTAVHLTEHQIPGLQSWVNLDEDIIQKLITQNSSIEVTQLLPCKDERLFSHLCVPTPANYMRCLCPTGFQLLSDGWTCGKGFPGVVVLYCKLIMCRSLNGLCY